MDNSYKKIQFGGWTGRSFAEVRERVYKFLDMSYGTLISEFEDDEDEPTDEQLRELESEDEPEGEEVKDD